MLALLLLIVPSDTTYWQQRVAYEITASLDEPSGVLSGKVRIRYVNQSPDTLRDFNVHQYLNAFRPGSRWSAADSAEQRVRFQHLKDPDYAFERITASNVMGERRAPDYPFAPDSTIAHWTLPHALAPAPGGPPRGPLGDVWGALVQLEFKPAEFQALLETMDPARPVADLVREALGMLGRK